MRPIKHVPVVSGLEIRLKKGTANIDEMAAGVCYCNGALTRGTIAISKGTTAIAAGSDGYFEPFCMNPRRSKTRTKKNWA